MEELTDKQHDDIAAYLAGQMSPAEKAGFEEQLSRNEALQQELLVQQRIRRGMELLSFEEEARALFARAMQEMTAEEETIEIATPVRPLWQQPSLWLAAAMVVLSLGLFWKFYDDDGGGGRSDTPVVRTDSTTDRPTPSDTSSRITPIPSPIPTTDRAVRLADAYFSPRPKENPIATDLPDEADAAATTDSAAIARDSAAVWQGTRLLAQKKAAEAMALLQKTVLEGYPGHWRAAAEWYLSLAYLQNNQTSEARAILTRIARTNGHPYQSEARRLRNELTR
ncbi:hypothetical protein GCM10023187_32000 [Nibrella viscosa]|uniref:Tetratricopeptide repeat-containing protein n=1 Tax=Nibrella viscosa TaxID=1084524 RepID=A0ABP8KL00_9BACT